MAEKLQWGNFNKCMHVCMLLILICRYRYAHCHGTYLMHVIRKNSTKALIAVNNERFKWLDNLLTVEILGIFETG